MKNLIHTLRKCSFFESRSFPPSDAFNWLLVKLKIKDGSAFLCLYLKLFYVTILTSVNLPCMLLLHLDTS